jgi:hypothetical protein
MSDLPTAVGLCKDNAPEIYRIANRAERNLLNCKEVGEDGWIGTFAEIAFTMNRCIPDVVLPREVCRLEMIDVCGRPIALQNQFYEYLRYGNGRMGSPDFHRGTRRFLPTTAYMRNNAVTQVELFPAPQILSVYVTNPVDVGKRILLQGTDQGGMPIFTQDVLNGVTGQFVTFSLPFATAPQQFSQLTGIQKDITEGQVQLFQVDPVTGAQVLLLTMEPSETTAWYRRYHLSPLPWNCCNGQPPIPPAASVVNLTAIAMLEHIDVRVDTDYFLIQELEALTLEAQSIRMSKNDSPAALAQAMAYHKEAVRLLIGQASRYLGKETPAIQFRPFGSASLARAGVGRIL